MKVASESGRQGGIKAGKLYTLLPDGSALECRSQALARPGQVLLRIDRAGDLYLYRVLPDGARSRMEILTWQRTLA